MSRGNNKKSWLVVLWLAGLVALIAFISGGFGQIKPKPAPPPRYPQMNLAQMQNQWPQVMAHAAAPARGNPNTPYTLVEFGDFQCPQCGKMRPVIESLLRASPDQVNLIFVHRPFPFNMAGEVMHQWAIPSATASQVAAAHGKFWQMYDLLYTHQDDLESGYYGDYAAQIGLNKTTFEKEMADVKYQSFVNQSEQYCDDLKIETTPTVVVHDNATGKLTAYQGADSSLPDAPKGYLGVKQLAANPPWPHAAKTAQKTP